MDDQFYPAYLFFYFLFCLAIGFLADQWNRSGLAWFIGSFIITPVLAFLLLIIFGRNLPRL